MEDPSPSLVWLASGMPNPENFPFRNLTVTLEGGKELSLSKDALFSGLQYGPSQGLVNVYCDMNLIWTSDPLKKIIPYFYEFSKADR